MLKILTSTGLSFTVAGNTGLSPFLTLFLVGLVERINPNVLSMPNTGEEIEEIIASWPSLIFLGVLSCLDFARSYVPVADDVMEHIMTIVIPIASFVGSLSTFGAYTVAETSYRRLLMFSSGPLLFFQIFVAVIGVGLALSMYLLKTLTRLTNDRSINETAAIGEASLCTITTLLALFYRPAAILTGGATVAVAFYIFKVRYLERKESSQSDDGVITEKVVDSELGGDYVNVTELEAPPVKTTDSASSSDVKS